MSKLNDPLLLACCVDYLLEHGGLAFVELVVSAKRIVKEESSRARIDPSVIEKPLSLNMMIGDDTEDQLEDILIDGNDGPMEIEEKRSTAELIDLVVGKLRKKEQQIICLRFGLRGNSVHTLEEVGEEFDVTRERIRQIEKSTLKLLRMHLTMKGFDNEYI